MTVAPVIGRLDRVWTRALVVAVMAPMFLLGCSGTHPVVVLDLRNESSQPIELTISSGDGGSSRSTTDTLQPWHVGLCPTAGVGLVLWPVSVAIAQTDGVAGGAMTWTAAPSGDLYARIDAEGQTHFNEPVPSQPPTCDLYQLGNA